ncbi:hypothetical protein AC1031_001382 [Aphanomyces cochlioides]|nr:hypothetical protein AC1031_001382 [Aphanomyces cochlioides]
MASIEALHAPVLVYFIGWPGTGKKTIGKALQKTLPGARFISNHHIIDLAGAIVGAQGREFYQSVRAAIHANAMELLFENLKTNPATSRLAIVTGSHAGGEHDLGVFQRVHEAAKRHEIRVIGILLDCDLEENKRRLVTDERIGKKLTRTDELQLFHTTRTIYEQVPHPLRLNVTHLSPEEAAAVIWTHVVDVCAATSTAATSP